MITIFSQDRKTIKKATEVCLSSDGQTHDICYVEKKTLRNFISSRSYFVYPLGSYQDETNAEFVLRCLFAAIQKGDKVFKMPEDNPMRIGACIETYLGGAVEKKQ